jgi:hypothetical protein
MDKSEMTFRMATVSITRNSGIRSQWRCAFVKPGDFLTAMKENHNAKGLKLKEVKMADHAGEEHVGVLLKLDGLPSSLPYTEVILFTEQSTTHVEYLLDKPEGLHEGHGKNLRLWQQSNDTEDFVGSGRPPSCEPKAKE